MCCLLSVLHLTRTATVPPHQGAAPVFFTVPIAQPFTRHHVTYFSLSHRLWHGGPPAHTHNPHHPHWTLLAQSGTCDIACHSCYKKGMTVIINKHYTEYDLLVLHT